MLIHLANAALSIASCYNTYDAANNCSIMSSKLKEYDPAKYIRWAERQQHDEYRTFLKQQCQNIIRNTLTFNVPALAGCFLASVFTGGFAYCVVGAAVGFAYGIAPLVWTELNEYLDGFCSTMASTLVGESEQKR